MSDLSHYKETISHKLMSFLTQKNYIKMEDNGLYYFEVDIVKINEEINKG